MQANAILVEHQTQLTNINLAQSTALPICRGHGCVSTELIYAHIIPRGFARAIMKEENNKQNLLVSDDNVKPMQHGIFDPNLLCADCDGLLGKLDDFALDVWRRFLNNTVSLTTALSSITLTATGWRSSFYRFSGVRRSPPALSAKAFPWELVKRLPARLYSGARPLSHLPMYQLLLSRFRPHPGFNPAHNYTLPIPRNFEGFSGWSFSLCGFSVLAKLDIMPFPVDWKPFVVNGSTKLTGVFVNFLETVEGKTLHAIAKRHGSRRGKSHPRP